MDIKNRFIKARITLLNNQPFFGVLALHLNLVEDNTYPFAAGTDGVKLIYNSKLLESFSDDDIRKLIKHEILHIALRHLSRRGTRNPIKWNIAADLCVNSRIRDDGEELSPAFLYDSKFHNLNVEQIYNLLPDCNTKNGCVYIRVNDNSEIGKVLDGHIELPQELRDEITEQWTTRITEAATVAKARGKLPGIAKEFLDEIFAPKLYWTDYLRRFVVSNISNDYSFLPPNKKYIESGFVLPSLQSEGLNDIVISVDVSGSIDLETDLKEFYGEIQGILDAFDVTLHVIQVDAKTQNVKMYQKGDILNRIEIHGRGGTSFRPPFEYVKEKNLNPQCLIYFTDLMGDFPKEKPSYPVLWVVTTDLGVPFGEVIRLRDRR